MKQFCDTRFYQILFLNLSTENSVSVLFPFFSTFLIPFIKSNSEKLYSQFNHFITSKYRLYCTVSNLSKLFKLISYKVMDDTVYTKNYAFKFVHPPHLYIQRIFQMWRLLHYISLCILQMYLLKVSKKKSYSSITHNK